MITFLPFLVGVIVNFCCNFCIRNGLTGQSSMSFAEHVAHNNNISFYSLV